MAEGRRAKSIVEGADRRWVFADSGDVPVACVLRLRRDELRARHPAITDADVAAARSFGWPALRRHAAFDLDRVGDLVVLCVCGEGFAVQRSDDWRQPTCLTCQRRYAVAIMPLDG